MRTRGQGLPQNPSQLRTPQLMLFASADLFGGGGQAIISVLCHENQDHTLNTVLNKASYRELLAALAFAVAELRRQYGLTGAEGNNPKFDSTPN